MNTTVALKFFTCLSLLVILSSVLAVTELVIVDIPAIKICICLSGLLFFINPLKSFLQAHILPWQKRGIYIKRNIDPRQHRALLLPTYFLMIFIVASLEIASRIWSWVSITTTTTYNRTSPPRISHTKAALPMIETENMARLPFLQRWNELPVHREYRTCQHSYIDFLHMIVLTAHLSATCFFYTSFMYYVKPFETSSTLGLLRERIREIAESMKLSVSLRRTSGNIIEFLNELGTCSDSDLKSFIDQLCMSAASFPLDWLFQFSNSHFQSSSSDPITNRTTIVMMGCFLREKCGYDVTGMRFMRNNEYRMVAIVVVFCFLQISEKFIPLHYEPEQENSLPSGDIYSFVDYIWDGTVARLFSKGFDERGPAARDCTLIDICLNAPEDGINFNWSRASLDRIMWVFQFGKRHIVKSTYERLKIESQNQFVDLTMYKAPQLLALSMAGLFYFTGINDSLYRTTGSKDALFHLHGHLPEVEKSDALRLGLVIQNGPESFKMGEVPGVSLPLKVVRVRTGFKVIKSTLRLPPQLMYGVDSDIIM